MLRFPSCVFVGALAACVLLAGCPVGVGGWCRDDSYCRGDLYCLGPSDGPVCGIAPQEQCAADADCVESVCHAVPDGCSPDGIGSQCDPSCIELGCADGFRCNAAGACEPVPCDEGFACPAYQRCDAAAAHATGPMYDRTHGCVSIPCDLDNRDAECPTGTVCVNGVCQEESGTCQEVTQVP